MTVLHTGSTQKFADGWQKVFGDKKKAKATKEAMKRTAKTKPPKRVAKAASAKTKTASAKAQGLKGAKNAKGKSK